VGKRYEIYFKGGREIIMKELNFEDKDGKRHPHRPCKICIVQAPCNIGERMFECQTVMDYYNALFHKDPTRIYTFNLNRFGVWQVFVTGHSEKRTIEDIVKLSEGKSIDGGPVFDYKKHLEYIKHLEALEYYDQL
jgi:hypothetical protein